MNTTNDLPNFLIVGGAKCGTTSIATYLAENEEIFISSIKEPHFFIADKLEGSSVQTLVNNFDDYKALFAESDAPMKGESSVFYLYYHEIAIPRILETLGRDTRIIILIRNPIDRAFSAYNYVRAKNSFETLEFDSALDAEESRLEDIRNSPMMHYTKVGRYPAMLRAYLDNFPNCHIELFDDVKKDAPALVNRLEKFLGVTETVRETMKIHNRGGMKWKNKGLGQIVKTISYRAKFLKDRFPWLRNFIRDAVEQKLLTKSEPLTKEQRLRLENVFREDLEQVSQMTGRNLDHWFSPTAKSESINSDISFDGAKNV